MSTPNPVSGLYCGDVIHRRFRPKKHLLRYRIFSLLIDLDKMDELEQASCLLSINKFNLVSFHEKDYGDQSGKLKEYILGEVATRLPVIRIEKIYLLTMPRVLGYVFNPLSIYFCYEADATLRAIVYEVSNTFGQRHNYVFNIDQSGRRSYNHECDKDFYVSPFLEMDLQYRFTITDPAHSFSLSIQALRNSDIVMNAVQNMTFQELSTINLARVFVSIPFMTLKVIAGIHIEALWLWLNGVRLVPKTASVDKATRYMRNHGR